jgi:hypothetical protein|uniref:Uncharacterized protein n=1 Tax=Picea glauca TaxID=3330 RepID=A0A101LUB0_PICGL|nr:hypothetical protein ABT39_MTgene2591 [Picea glauca]QHR87082.1 hypothetical protein Q903MT_gene1091 [Picea sitchensis]
MVPILIWGPLVTIPVQLKTKDVALRTSSPISEAGQSSRAASAAKPIFHMHHTDKWIMKEIYIEL